MALIHVAASLQRPEKFSECDEVSATIDHLTCRFMIDRPKPKVENETIAVVLIGSFNPRIFHPQWLVRNGLIGESDGMDAVAADRSDGPIITPQLARFDIGRDSATLQFFCDADRLQIMAATILGETRLLELAHGVLHQLQHLPITSVGINYTMTFAAKDEAQWHAIGHLLAPKEKVWSKILEKPGMLFLQIQGRRDGPFPGYRNVSVRPIGISPSVTPLRVEIGVNCHYSLPTLTPSLEAGTTTRVARQYLDSEWKESVTVGQNTAEEILAALINAN